MTSARWGAPRAPLHSLRRFRALPSHERRLLVRAMFLLVLARVRLPSLAFRAERTGGGREPASSADGRGLAHGQVAARLLAIAASRLPLHTTCLHRSVALWWLLRRDGVPCALRLGARAGGGAFAAHAWVECGGVALGEAPGHERRYHPFAGSVCPARGEAFATGSEQALR